MFFAAQEKGFFKATSEKEDVHLKCRVCGKVVESVGGMWLYSFGAEGVLEDI